MTAIPKCTSWLGHRFEGRYSSEPLQYDGDRKIDVQGVHAIEAIQRINSTVTYERDICVRCGATIEKAILNGEAPKTQA